MAINQGYSGNLGGGYLSEAKKAANRAASTTYNPYAFAARAGTKGYLKNKYGINASDDDITWRDGQVYLYGQSLGKADGIDAENGRAYYGDPAAVQAKIDKIVENMPDPGVTKTYNSANSAISTDRSAITDSYGNYLDRVQEWASGGNYLDPKIEAAIREAYGYDRAVGGNEALAGGAARNGGNIDSLSMQNRANYNLAVNSAINKALIDAMNTQYTIDSGRMDAWRSGLGQYGDYTNNADNLNITRQKNEYDYDIQKRDADRLDRESAANIDRQNSEVMGVGMGSLNQNPYLVNGKLPDNWEERDYQAEYNAMQKQYDAMQKQYDAYMADYEATGNEGSKAAADRAQTAAGRAQTAMDQIAQARALKLQQPGYGQWANTQPAFDGAVASGRTVQRDANQQNFDLGMHEIDTNLKLGEIAADAQKYGYDKELEGIKDTNLANEKIADIQAEADKYGYELSAKSAIEVARIAAAADVDVATVTAKSNTSAAVMSLVLGMDENKKLLQANQINALAGLVVNGVGQTAADGGAGLDYSGIKKALGMKRTDSLQASDVVNYLNGLISDGGYDGAVAMDKTTGLPSIVGESGETIMGVREAITDDENLTDEEKRQLKQMLGI